MDTNEIRLEAQDLNQQGAMLLKTGNFEAAKQKFDKAIEIDPMLMDSYKNYGDFYMSTQEYQNAKNSYKKAMLIEKSGLLHFLYGNACFMNDELHEGLESYNLAINEGYDSAEMMFFMGMAYEHMHDDNLAMRYFQKACVKNPSRPDYLVKKIGTLVRLGMYDNANEATDELLVKAPEMFDGYHIKTQLLLYEEKYDEAVSFAKSASERFPEDADLAYDYAKALSLSKKLDDAIKVIESSKNMKYFSDAIRQFTLLEGQIYAECNNFEKAVACCEECIALEENDGFDGEARFMLMNLYLAEPNYEKALEQSMEIVKNDSEDIYYYAALYYRPFCTKHKVKTKQGSERRKYYSIPEKDRLTKEDIEQGTVTISNLGSLYREQKGFGTLIEIVPPQVCAFALGAVQDKPVVVTDKHGNKSVQIRQILPITIVFDHRALDFGGVVPFIRQMDNYLTNPEVLQEWRGQDIVRRIESKEGE